MATQFARCARARVIGTITVACALATGSIAATTTYEYDALGRLKTVTRTDGATITYTLDAAGNRTQVVTEILDVIAPSVPAGLAATAVAHNRVDVSWNAATDNPGGTGVAGYRVYRDGALLVTTSSTSHADTTVSGSTTYSYRVAAYDGASPANVSAQSAPAGATTPPTPDTTPPTVPTGLNASAASSSQVNLSWNASSDTGGSGLAGYKIYRNSSYLTSVSGTSHSDTTVAASTSYNYNVYAYDGASNTSGASNTASVTTPGEVPSTPAQVWTSPAGVSYGGNFTVLWSASSGVAYYRLEEDKDDNGSVEFTYTVNAPATSKSLAKGGTYKELYYRVQACNSSNQCSSLSSVVAHITTCPTQGCP